MHKSLPAIILSGMWGLYIASRWKQDGMILKVSQEFPKRIALVIQDRYFLLGVAALLGFAITNGLSSTQTAIGPSLGYLRFILIPILLVLSIILSFAATGLLFLLLYPIFPFKEGYLKAIFFTFILLSIFVLGVGADNRLITSLGDLMVGRLIYYLSVPLLIGFSIDITNIMDSTSEKTQGAASSKESEGKEGNRQQVGLQYIGKIQKSLKALGPILSIVAPAAYAAVFDHPLIVTYFQLIKTLTTFS